MGFPTLILRVCKAKPEGDNTIDFGGRLVRGFDYLQWEEWIQLLKLTLVGAVDSLNLLLEWTELSPL
jgi:hypothetical protein